MSFHGLGADIRAGAGRMGPGLIACDKCPMRLCTSRHILGRLDSIRRMSEDYARSGSRLPQAVRFAFLDSGCDDNDTRNGGQDHNNSDRPADDQSDDFQCVVHDANIRTANGKQPASRASSSMVIVEVPQPCAGSRGFIKIRELLAGCPVRAGTYLGRSAPLARSGARPPRIRARGRGTCAFRRGRGYRTAGAGGRMGGLPCGHGVDTEPGDLTIDCLAAAIVL